MYNFIKCPFCSGHELVSPETTREIADMIATWVHGMPESHVLTELENIRNVILNQGERAEAIDPLLQ